MRGYQVVGYFWNLDWTTGRNVKVGEEVVATFDKESDACLYLKKSRLKNVTNNRPFRQKSLLAPFEYAAVRWVSRLGLPIHNPII